MITALWSAKTGLDAQQTKMSVISNNLANASTVGFKRDRAVFEDLMYQNLRQSGSQTSQETTLPSGLNIGTGVRIVATEKLITQGNMQNTDNPLDMAIQGRGYFEVQMPDGTTGYTRNGEFQVNAEGQIVTANGYLLQPGITIPENVKSLDIGVDGTVSALLSGDTAPQEIGQIQIADFINPTGLQPLGGNLLGETASSGAPQLGSPSLDGLGSIQQGSLETSNVNVVEELVNMIETQRAYEINSKAISSTDDMLAYVNNNL
ncbi:unnamed protein product [Cyprideis torosa]|uniref:Flagellar basal-body rod protein FlgG n=1 Tax=Cyprideis torosa TaxID=163714 RepID=A0A7R8WSW6_9CRUS|nr:unnamed protein product [Cyprideis torosa]CAG0909634.1 unnamed protein product [Cyprideis torosa]